MPITVIEQDTLDFEMSDDGPVGATVRYLVFGSNDRAALDAALLAEIDDPDDLDLIVGRRKWKRAGKDGAGEDGWLVDVEYTSRPSRKIGDKTTSVEIGTGTQRIKRGEPISDYAPSGETAPDYDGLINVTDDGVEGIDVNFATFTFVESHVKAAAFLDASYFAVLRDLSWKCNNATFRGFSAGEVVFTGASARQPRSDRWEIEYRFAVSKNLTGLSAGSITGIAKDGWDVLWHRTRRAEDAGSLTVEEQVSSAHTVRVYSRADFSLLDIG